MAARPTTPGKGATTLVDLLRWRAERQPERTAVTYLSDDDATATTLSYLELDRSARSVAARLQDASAPGDPVLLLYPPGPEFHAGFLGCLYAGRIAVPAYPPDPARLGRSLPRLQAIVADARAACVLTTAPIAALLGGFSSQAPDLVSLRRLATDAAATNGSPRWRNPGLVGRTVAFLQYTSGSTGMPRGVVLSHDNLVHNQDAVQRTFGVTERSVLASWLPIYHDMGMCVGLLQPLYSGAHTVLMSPLAFLKQPLRWLEAISRYGASHTVAPNFAFDLCVRKSSPEQRRTLDLSSVEVAIVGSERVNHETLEEFAAAFSDSGFRRSALFPSYGLAEATLLVSGSRASPAPPYRPLDKKALGAGRIREGRGTRADTVTLVGCGAVVPGHLIAIVDPEELTECPPERVGEIWVSGPSVAEGYWGLPDETERSFRARLADTGEGPFLRTGDLGFVSDGELFVTGRIKDLIVVRGRNHYPADVEATVEKCHGAVRRGCCAAFSVDAGGDEAVVVLAELDRSSGRDPAALDAVLAAIRRAVAEEHDLGLFVAQLLEPGSIPKTSSGKLQRGACRSSFEARSLEPVAEWRTAATEAGDRLAARGQPVYATGHAAREIEDWLSSWVGERVGLEPARVDRRQAFALYGLGSSDLAGLAGDIEARLARTLSPGAIWEHPTIRALARYLIGQPDEVAPEMPAARGAEPIAIIGIGCRFPGGADDPATYWKLLSNGVDAISEVPADRWDLRRWYDPDPARPGRMNTRWGGFLDRIDQLDREFFQITPREAERMDPQQRLLLEVSWEALESAGLGLEALAGSQTGVFIGVSTMDYALLQAGDERPDPYTLLGAAHSVHAGRISYLFDLQGPSMAVDTACSSSLVALHLACQSLRNRECRTALAGGVNALAKPGTTVGLSQGGFLASDGRCKTFDASADGFVRGEGCGVVALKRLSDALADGDEIWALVRGSAVNQDGRSVGLTAPNPRAQQRVVRAALADAGLDPSRISYVEAHGTGTPLGDPVEIEALAAVVGQPREDGLPCAIGSAKTNIGHLEAAAGVAGLIKVVMSLRHRQIPPHLHLERLNPSIALDGTRLRVPTRLEPWHSDAETRYAGVSSFGFSGTNAHAILQEAPRPAGDAHDDADADRTHLLPLSARSASALKATAYAYRGLLAGGNGSSGFLRDVCHSAALHRTHHAERLCVVGATPDEVGEKLDAFGRGQIRGGVSAGTAASGARRALAFVFSGQGSQWPGMGAELWEREPVFRQALEDCDRLHGRLAGRPLAEELLRDEAASRLSETEIAQPAIFALQVALLALWRSWGIEPSVVLGHSVGEVAAAHAAGVLDLETAMQVVIQRGRLMQRTAGLGGMVSLDLSESETTHWLAGERGDLCVGALNGPTSTVVSGPVAALEALVRKLEAHGVGCRRLQVDHAFHSSQMNPIRGELEQALASLEPGDAALPICSSVSGEFVEGSALDAAYWGRNLREPVRFADAVRCLADAGITDFLEIGGHPALAPALREILSARGREEGLVLASLRRGRRERESLLDSAGALHCAGHPVQWHGLSGPGAQRVALPTYPWQRERFWNVDADDTGGRRSGGEVSPHPLLGYAFRSALDPEARLWQMELDADALASLALAPVEGRPSAAACAEMVLGAARETRSDCVAVLEALDLEELHLLPETGAQSVVQVALLPVDELRAHVRLFARRDEPEPGAPEWSRFARGVVRFETAPHEPEAVRLEELKERFRRESSTPAFQGETGAWGSGRILLRDLQRGDGELLARLCLDESVAPWQRGGLHPALVHAAFELASYLGDTQSPSAGAGRPVRLHELRSSGAAPTELWVHARLVPGSQSAAQLGLFDLDGLEVCRVERLDLKPIEPGAHEVWRSWLYALEWQERERPEPESARLDCTRRGSWLALVDGGELRAALREELLARGQGWIEVEPGDGYRRLRSNAYQVDPSRPEDFERLFHEAFSNGTDHCLGVLQLWGSEQSGGDDDMLGTLDRARRRGCEATLHLLQAIVRAPWNESPGLWLVTRGAQGVEDADPPVCLEQSPLWGLGRVVALEHPELRCTRVDLCPSRGDTDAEARALADELVSQVHEDEIALRRGQRYVRRLVRTRAGRRRGPGAQGAAAGARPFRLELEKPGSLEHLQLRETCRRSPGAGEVEIAVRAAGLNFKDVLLALALVPGNTEETLALGGECAGIVTALGEGVSDLRVGDEVVAIAAHSLGRFVTTPAAWVVPRPPGLAFEEAAVLPLVFTTAHYALNHLARLRSQERILIHSAAGGVGHAALQLARRTGAEIFATAGSEDRREYLRCLGVECVSDSRGLGFAREILQATGGAGVDVVLNSLTGAAVERNFEILAPNGRFVEIGVRDLHDDRNIRLGHFVKNLSYSAFDLSRIAAERPALLASLLREAMQGFETGELSPPPLQVFPLERAGEAFRLMAQARHLGKLALTLERGEEIRIAPATPNGSPPSHAALAADATYLVTGGLGGLGLTVARWLVGRGARHLVLMGRRGPMPVHEPALRELRESGAEVVVVAGDVSLPHAVQDVLSRIDAAMPPLRGLIHAAGILDDGILMRQDRERLARVMAPKVPGAWNLHALTADRELDFFVMFSSAASLLGSPGQASYTAANAFLDALAHHRRRLGLPALSVNWGPWAEVGMAATQKGPSTRVGLASIGVEQGLEILGELLGTATTQIGVVPLDLPQWLESHPQLAELTLLEEVLGSPSDGPGAPRRESDFATALRAARSEASQHEMLAAHVQQQIGAVLHVDPLEVDVRAPLTELGLDSLMAVELKTRLERGLGIPLTPTLVFRYPTVEALVPGLAAMLGIVPRSSPDRAAEPEPFRNASGAEELEQEEEVETLLLQRLAQIEERI